MGGTQQEREQNSAEIYRQLANEFLPRSVVMKEDTPGNHPYYKLPILDTKMSVVYGQIVSHHYAKPMAFQEVTRGRLAMSKASKYNILIQEGCRKKAVQQHHGRQKYYS